MKNTFKIISIVVGLSVFVWGAKLIHHNYAHERNVTYMLKSGNIKISNQILSGHSEQAAKDLIVHLGLIVIGVCLIIVPITIHKMAHNKSGQGAP